MPGERSIPSESTTSTRILETPLGGTLVRPQPKRAEDSIAEYVRYFDRVAKANGWSDSQAAQVFPGLLEVGSTDLDDLSEATLGSFSAMKAALIQVEESFREASVQAFFWNMSMREEEKVHDFAKRCRSVVHECYPGFAKSNKDILARDRFVHGLPAYLKSAVLNNRSKKWEEALQSALMAEGVAETLGSRGKGKSKKEASKELGPSSPRLSYEEAQIWRSKSHVA